MINRKRPPMIFITVLAVVVAAGIVAVVASRGSGGDEVEGQTRKVEVGAPTTTAEAAPQDSTTSEEEQAHEQQALPTTVVDGEAAGASALPPLEDMTTDPAVGQVIPSVTGEDFAGTRVTIAPDGKAKVLLFVAHWCPHCQREVPLLADHLADTPMPDDVELITVSTSVRPEGENYPPEAWLAREGWAAPVLADDGRGTVAQMFGLSGFPYFVVVDAEGKVVQRTSGELPVEVFDGLVKAAQTGEAYTG